MVSVTIEYVILIPLLFSQVIVFPLVASTMANSWQDSQRDVALQEVANHLASNIQQLYLTVNRDEIMPGNMIQTSTLPVTIASYSYNANATLSTPSNPGVAKILTVTLKLDALDNTVTANAVLGYNVQWGDSIFRSNSANASIYVYKSPDNLISFSFGAD